MTRLEDGKLMLFGRERLWSEDHTTRNDPIALLDGQTDGKYYDEVVAWIQSAS